MKKLDDNTRAEEGWLFASPVQKNMVNMIATPGFI